MTVGCALGFVDSGLAVRSFEWIFLSSTCAHHTRPSMPRRQCNVTCSNRQKACLRSRTGGLQQESCVVVLHCAGSLCLDQSGPLQVVSSEQWAVGCGCARVARCRAVGCGAGRPVAANHRSAFAGGFATRFNTESLKLLVLL